MKVAEQTHGLSRSREYKIWTQMKGRCLNPNNAKYSIYGARGIAVCERWLKFESFIQDMGFPPTERHSLDRIDFNGNYEPSNCRWATAKEQANNRRKRKAYDFEKRGTLIEVNGHTYVSISSLSRKVGISSATILQRLKNGLTGEALLAPKQKCGRKKSIISRNSI